MNVIESVRFELLTNQKMSERSKMRMKSTFPQAIEYIFENIKTDDFHDEFKKQIEELPFNFDIIELSKTQLKLRYTKNINVIFDFKKEWRKRQISKILNS